MKAADGRSGDLLRLGALEAQVMDVLWDHGPATVREVIEHLPSDPAYTTIATLEQEVASDEAQRARFSARAADSTSGDAAYTREP